MTKPPPQARDGEPRPHPPVRQAPLPRVRSGRELPRRHLPEVSEGGPLVTTVVQLLARDGTVLAQGAPDPDTGDVTWSGDNDRPPQGGHPRLRLTHEQDQPCP